MSTREQPAAAWAAPNLVRDPDYLGSWRGEQPERVDPPSPFLRAMQHEIAQRTKLRALLGAVYMNTGDLIMPPRGALLPLCVYRGQPLRFSLWAPHRRWLIDIFTEAIDADELHARDAYASQHGLRYSYVPPGHGLSFEDLERAAQSPRQETETA